MLNFSCSVNHGNREPHGIQVDPNNTRIISGVPTLIIHVYHGTLHSAMIMENEVLSCLNLFLRLNKSNKNLNFLLPQIYFSQKN